MTTRRRIAAIIAAPLIALGSAGSIIAVTTTVTGSAVTAVDASAPQMHYFG